MAEEKETSLSPPYTQSIEDLGFKEALCCLWDSEAKYIIELENVTT